MTAPGADGEFDNEDVTGSIAPWPRVTHPSSAATAGDAAIRAEERRSKSQ